MTKRVTLILLAAVSLLVALSSMTRAADENRAAVVVAFGGGVVATRCVSFSEPEITGFDLLQRSGLSLLVEDQGMGSLVCSIEGTGCPADDCLCGCRGGGDCVYWSYWQRANDAWVYSAAGATVRRITDGAVDGWVWGPGSVTEAIPPPALSFDDVCTTGEATATATPSATATLLVVPTFDPATETPSVTTSTARPVASPTAGGTLTGTAAPTAAAGTATGNAPATPLDDPSGTPPGSTVTPLPAATPRPGNTVAPPAVAPAPGATEARATAGPAPVSSGGGEGYPAGVGSETAASPAIIAQVVTPAVGLVPTTPSSTEASSVAAQVTVIGAAAVPAADAATMEDAATTDVVADSSATPAASAWLPYAALGAMLLVLGGLVLVARRRGEQG